MGRTSDARERLILAARGLFHANSYESVSVDDLCREADVRKGSFYHFFPSKRDLAIATLDAYWERTRTEVIDPALTGDDPPLARIERLFLLAASHQGKLKKSNGHFLGCAFGNLTMEMSTQDETLRTHLNAIFDRFAGRIEAVLAEAAARGEMNPNDVSAGARTVLSLLYGSILLAKAANDEQILKENARRAVALLAR